MSKIARKPAPSLDFRVAVGKGTKPLPSQMRVTSGTVSEPRRRGCEPAWAAALSSCSNLNFWSSYQVSWRPTPQFERYFSGENYVDS